MTSTRTSPIHTWLALSLSARPPADASDARAAAPTSPQVATGIRSVGGTRRSRDRRPRGSRGRRDLGRDGSFGLSHRGHCFEKGLLHDRMVALLCNTAAELLSVADRLMVVAGDFDRADHRANRDSCAHLGRCTAG